MLEKDHNKRYDINRIEKELKMINLTNDSLNKQYKAKRKIYEDSFEWIFLVEDNEETSEQLVFIIIYSLLTILLGLIGYNLVNFSVVYSNQFSYYITQNSTLP